MKVYIQKHLTDTCLIGKVERDNKTKWEVRFRPFGTSYIKKV